MFFRAWWLNAVCDGEWDVAMIKKEDELIAVWPYQTERKFGFKIIRNPLLTPYLGPLWLSEEKETHNWIETLWQQIPASDLLQWTCLPNFHQADLFAKKQVQHLQKLTYYIDLKRSEAELWQQLHSTRRNGIRKGGQELSIEQCDLNIEQFISWHKKSFENKNKKYPYSSAFLEKAVSSAVENNACVCFQAKDNMGKIHGILWLAYDHNTMYYLLSTTADDANRGAMALLAWHAILYAKKEGLAVFDFEGSMDPGIARFFQRFGGQKLHYDEFSITYSPLWKLKNKLLG